MSFWKRAERLLNGPSPYTKRETVVNEATTAASLCLFSQEECMPRCRENNLTIAEWYPVCFFRGRSNTEEISTLQQIFEKSWEPAKDVHTCFVDLGKVYGRVPLEKLWVMLWEYSVDGCLLLAVKKLYSCSEGYCAPVDGVNSQPFSVIRVFRSMARGQIWPTKPFHPAAKHILPIIKK